MKKRQRAGYGRFSYMRCRGMRISDNRIHQRSTIAARTSTADDSTLSTVPYTALSHCPTPTTCRMAARLDNIFRTTLARFRRDVFFYNAAPIMALKRTSVATFACRAPSHFSTLEHGAHRMILRHRLYLRHNPTRGRCQT
jgi:hypothetical protein